MPTGVIRARQLAHQGAIWTGLCSEFFFKLGDDAKEQSRAEHGLHCWKPLHATY